MGRTPRQIDPSTGLIARFASELRALRLAAGEPSYREMARRVHFSRSALAHAASGRAMPTLPVTLGYVKACGGDVSTWHERWDAITGGLNLVPAAQSDSPWPTQPAEDGSDPDAAGCGHDAITVHAQRIALQSEPLIVGQVQLRFSPRKGAAWSRFEGFASLDRLATVHHVDIEVRVHRDTQALKLAYRTRYVFDYHWSDLLRTGTGLVFASTTVYLDGHPAASGETRRLSLP